MNLLWRSWKESLAVFGPGQFKLLALVTLKGLMSTYRHWIIYFWWLLIACVAIDNLYTWFTQEYPESLSYMVLVPLACWSLCALALYLSARPSVMRKSYRYYRHYLIFFFPLFLFIILGTLIVGLFSLFVAKYVSIYALLLPAFFFIPCVDIPFFLSPLCLLFVFFMLDGPVTIGGFFLALWRAYKMMVYNYPFFLILFLVGMFIYRVIIMSETFLGSYADLIALVIVMPLMACITATFYTRRLADQFSLYYQDHIKESV